VEAIPQRSSNIALGRQVYCSRGVAPGLPSRNLTDGFFSTYSHPDPATGGEGAFFELDLGQMTPLDHIVVRGRKDGAEADRLGAYRVQTFTEPVGLPWQTQWQARRRTDGSLMAAGSADVIRARDGKGTFSGRRIRIHNESGRNPQPQIAEVEVYPALFPQAQDWLADDRALGPGSEVAVPVGARQLRFTIDCGAFANLADAVIYRWRLSGWRDEWRETTADGRVLISPAPPAGLYTLHLQARHSDGVWDESGAPVSLRIALPWWRNPPLLAAGVSGVLVLAAALWWRVKTSVMKRRLAVAEQHLSLQRERLRIARDLHDEMGANLTQIALLSELTRCDFDNPGQAKGHMDEVFRTARSLTRSLDEIVWAVNPANDTLERFVAHLCTYAPRFLQSAGVGCRLEVPEELPDIPLSAGVRHHLHLSVKESLHNIVKHAQATEVWLRLRLAPATLTLIIEDNGRGIPTAAPAPGADGLGNLRQRMCEIGGSFEQRNRDGKGTIITLVAPLKREGL
jgi:signal transduction histidine kinase